MENNRNLNAVEEYNKIQKERTLLLHRILLILFVIIDISLFAFIIAFNSNFRSLSEEFKEKAQTLSIVKEKNEKKNFAIERMMLNLYINLKGSTYITSSIFRSVEEFNFVINNVESVEKPVLYICYKGSVDGDNNDEYNKYCVFSEQLFLFETKNGNRFGAYFSKIPELSENSKDSIMVAMDETSFLFNLDKKKIYKIREDCKISFTRFKDGFFILGDDDIHIEEGYIEKEVSFSDFPRCYGDENSSNFELTSGEKNFKLADIEIYNLFSIH